MLEAQVPDASMVVGCFVTGPYYFKKRSMQVVVVKRFLATLKSATDEKRRIVLSNLHACLDALPRDSVDTSDDDVPF